jgi:hypothetical protein
MLFSASIYPLLQKWGRNLIELILRCLDSGIKDRFRNHLINKHMSNREFLQRIYEAVRSMGLVQSQYEFGELCGRKQSWFSCAKSTDRQMSMGALVSLAVSLDRMPTDRVPRKLRPMRKELVNSIWSMIEAQGSQRSA